MQPLGVRLPRVSRGNTKVVGAKQQKQPRRKGQGGLHGSPIEDYCLIGDCETAALVSRHGSVDWLCWPDFSSPACFAALLGSASNGHWQLAPQDKHTVFTRRYRPRTLILETTMETPAGSVLVTDFMPI